MDQYSSLLKWAKSIGTQDSANYGFCDDATYPVNRVCVCVCVPQELEDSMEMYHDLYSEHTATKQRYEKELVELKEKLQRAVPPSTSGDEPSSGDDESYNSSSDQSGESSLFSAQVCSQLIWFLDASNVVSFLVKFLE